MYFRVPFQNSIVRRSFLACLCVFFLPCVTSRLFEIQSSVCHIKLDVQFSATFTAKRSGTVVAEKTITEADVTDVDGACNIARGNYIDLEMDHSTFRFHFKANGFSPQATVTLTPMFYSEPRWVFPDVEFTNGYACFKGPSINTGGSQYSYLCPIAGKIHYSKTTCDSHVSPLGYSPNSYSVELNMKKIQAQAYNLRPYADFSPHVTCKQPRNFAGIIAGSVVAVVVVLAIVAIVVVLVIRRRKKSSSSDNSGQTTNANERSPLRS